MDIIALRIGSYERSRRIQYLEARLSDTSDIERRDDLMDELEIIQEVDSEIINDLPDL